MRVQRIVKLAPAPDAHPTMAEQVRYTTTAPAGWVAVPSPPVCAQPHPPSTLHPHLVIVVKGDLSTHRRTGPDFRRPDADAAC